MLGLARPLKGDGNAEAVLKAPLDSRNRFGRHGAIS
jgi:hypothetical protein